MLFDNFLYYFGHVDMVEMNDNNSYVYKSVTDRYQKGVYFKITIAK